MTPNLTPAQIERLALLAGELCEAGQAIAKIVRHGWLNTHPDFPGGPTNLEQLESELGHVHAALALMYEAHDIQEAEVLESMRAKLEKVHRFLYHQDAPARGGQ